MNLDTAILVTTFVLAGASLLLSKRWVLQGTTARERQDAAELDTILRPALLFRTTAPVAMC
jgi:hypothetical protein